MGPNCQVCHGNLTTFWRPGVLEFFGGHKGLSRRAFGGPNLQDIRLFIDSNAFWGSKSIGYQAFYRFKCVLGSKSIGYQAFYRFKCVLGSKSIGYQAFYRFKCVFGGPTQPISQIGSAQIPLFIGFGASAPIGFLKQGAQLQDPIHLILEAHFTKAQ